MAFTLLFAPPATRIENVVEQLHGVEVRDPYRWLEGGDSAEVQAWTSAQTRYLREHLDPLPTRPWLEARLRRWLETGALGTPVVRTQGRKVRLFYTRRDGQQNQPVLYVRAGRGGKDRALVDANRMAADGTAALDWWYPSEDGALVAYGISTGGDESSTLRVREVESGRDRPDTVPRTRACSLAWLPDGSGFYYTRYPRPGEVPAGEEAYHRAVYLHRLGEDPARDPRVFGDGLALSSWPEVRLSPSGRWLGIEVAQGWSRTDLYLLDRERGGPPTVLVKDVEANFGLVKVLDDRLYVLTNHQAPRYQLVAIDPERPQREDWKVVIPESEDVLESVTLAGDRLVAVYLHEASARAVVLSRAGAPVRALALPPFTTVSGVRGRPKQRDVFLATTSFLSPTQILRHDLAAGTTAVWRKLEPPVDTSRLTVEQVHYPSKDGTRIPMFLVHRRDLRRDGRNPTLLYGYGGFNVSLTPAFAAWVGPFLERGGVYAVPNLRGGGELGEAWHRAGMLGRKQNVFDDFAAAASYLFAERITTRERLAIAGRSNGGLLTAATLVQNPGLCRAAIVGVPLTDMLRYHRLQIARLWIPEYGSPEDPDAFAWLSAYSPYHRVTNGNAYPATLLLSAESDTRVDPMHARKLAARLQAATSSKQPILLRLETQAGHGAGKPLSKLVAQYTDEFAFLFWQLGLSAPPP